MGALVYWQVGVAGLLAAIAVWTDVRTWRIPNWLTLTGIALGLGLGLASGGGRGLLFAAVGALVTALVPLLLFRVSAMGGGDVKLFAALGALLGAGAGLETQMTAFMVGGLQGVFLWARRGELKKGFRQSLSLFVPSVFKKPGDEEKRVARTQIKFAPAIFAGLVLAMTLRFIG